MPDNDTPQNDTPPPQPPTPEENDPVPKARAAGAGGDKTAWPAALLLCALALSLFAGLCGAQTHTQTTGWCELAGASSIVENGSTLLQQRRHAAIEPFHGTPAQLVHVRSEVAFQVAAPNAKPILYGVENLGSVVPGYEGAYGGIFWIHATRDRADGGPSRRLLFGTSFWIQMASCISLDSSDGQVDYQGPSAHVDGAGGSLPDLSGPGFTLDFGPGLEQQAALFCDSTPGGPLEITLAPQASGGMTSWPGWSGSGHKPWSDRWTLDGSLYSVKVRLRYDWQD